MHIDVKAALSRLLLAGGTKWEDFLPLDTPPLIKMGVALYLGERERDLPASLDAVEVPGGISVTDEHGEIAFVACTLPVPDDGIPTQEEIEADIHATRTLINASAIKAAQYGLKAAQINRGSPVDYYSMMDPGPGPGPGIAGGSINQAAASVGMLPPSRYNNHYQGGSGYTSAWNIDRKMGGITAGLPGWEKALLFRGMIWPFCVMVGKALYALSALFGLIMLGLGMLLWAFIYIMIQLTVLFVSLFFKMPGYGNGKRRRRR